MGIPSQWKCKRAIAIALPLLVFLIAHSSPSPAQMMDGRRDSMGPSHGDRTMEGVGAGIGLGLAIGNTLQQQKDTSQKGPADDTAKKPPKSKKDISQQKKKEPPPPGKPAAQPPSQAQQPQEPKQPTGPADPPPATTTQTEQPPEPTFAVPCPDCTTLIERVARLTRQIEVDVAKANEIARERDNATTELTGYERGLAQAVEAVDKTYYTKMIALTKDSIRSRTDLFEQIKARVQQQRELLARETVRLKDCIANHCGKVSVTPPEPPTSGPPGTNPPVQVAQTPSDPKAGPDNPRADPKSEPKIEPKTEPKPDPKDEPKTAEQSGPVCGPDITENILTVLRRIHHNFTKVWTPSNMGAACHALIRPDTALSAWDIAQLNPDSTSDGLTTILAGRGCGEPRQLCGNTVSFMGTCQDPQVVNYVQWGMMLELCSSIWGGSMFSGPGKGLHVLRNKVKWAASLGTNIDRTTGQTNMMEVGASFAGSLSEIYPTGKMPDAVVAGIAKRLQDRERSDARPEQKCTQVCTSAASRKVLSDYPFHYTWEPVAPRGGNN